jgi:flagellar motor switch protein FliM
MIIIDDPENETESPAVTPEDNQQTVETGEAQPAIEEASPGQEVATEGEALETKESQDLVPDADDLASDWDAMLSSDDSQEQKTLSQREIDSLLGISVSSAAKATGLQILIHNDLVHYERLPMLEIIFDRLMRLLSTSLRNFTSENVEVSLESMTSIRFGDYINSIPLPAMISVFKAREWNDFGLLTVDSSLIYTIIDVLLGGRKGSSLLKVEGRPYSTIERRLIEKMNILVLEEFQHSFHPLCEVNFDFDRLETNPAFVTIARPSNAAIVATLHIDINDRGGKFEFLLPYSTIEPIRDLLLQGFMGEKFGQDSIWEKHLAAQLWQTEFTLDAILDEVTLKLSDVINLKPGSQIVLTTTPESPIQLRCGDVSLFSGNVGHKGKKVAVKIENTLYDSQKRSVGGTK